jgi:hypothetical protein
MRASGNMGAISGIRLVARIETATHLPSPNEQSSILRFTGKQ